MTFSPTSDLFRTPQPTRTATNVANSAPTTGTVPTFYSFHNSTHQLAHPRSFLYTTPDTDPAVSTEQRSNDTHDPSTTAHPNSQTTFTFEQVQQLLQMANSNRFLPPPHFPPPPIHPSHAPQPSDDPYALLKIEQIASQGLSTKFDGELINFASFFQEASSQINVSIWKDATTIIIDGKMLNLLQDFMLIPRDALTTQATKRWTDPALLLNHNKKATKEFHIKLLSLFLLNSITTAFRTIIQNRAPDLLRHDGQLLFWLICNHVHSSKNAFQKSIKDVIKTRSISTDDKGNVESYVMRHLQTDERDQSANDLLDSIFAQLSHTGIERLTLSVDDWYEAHMSNEAPLTPLSLLSKTDRKLQLLRCANKLTPKSDEPQIMALQSIIQDQNDKFTAAFSSITNSLNKRPTYFSNHPSPRAPFDHIPWKLTPPTNVHEVRLYNNKEWRWCPKCHHRKGMWVTTHRASEHDNYLRPPSPGASILRPKTPPPYQVLRSSPPSTPNRNKRSYPVSPGNHQSPKLKRTQFHAQVAVSEFIPPVDDLVDYSAAQSDDEDPTAFH